MTNANASAVSHVNPQRGCCVVNKHSTVSPPSLLSTNPLYCHRCDYGNGCVPNPPVSLVKKNAGLQQSCFNVFLRKTFCCLLILLLDLNAFNKPSSEK